jgi:hypothetical protein
MAVVRSPIGNPISNPKISKLLAAALLMLCVGLQALEATGRWDRTLQDAGDEAVIVAVVLCVGAALVVASRTHNRVSLSLIHSPIPPVRLTSQIALVPPAATPALGASPPLSLRI